MKILKYLFTIIIIIAFVQNTEAQKLKSEMDSISYSIGVLIAKDLQKQGLEELNIKAFNKAMADVMEGNDLEISAEDAVKNYQDHMQAQQGQVGGENLAEGEAFLAENAKKKGVQTTESGLQYEVITEGNGAKPTAENTVEVHYHGTLLNGEVFDSSVQRGEKISFPLNRVIPGWTEGVQLMNVGSKYRFFIPANLAYGERGAGGQIGPNMALIFEVELFDIK